MKKPLIYPCHCKQHYLSGDAGIPEAISITSIQRLPANHSPSLMETFSLLERAVEFIVNEEILLIKKGKAIGALQQMFHTFRNPGQPHTVDSMFTVQKASCTFSGGQEGTVIK